MARLAGCAGIQNGDSLLVENNDVDPDVFDGVADVVDNNAAKFSAFGRGVGRAAAFDNDLTWKFLKTLDFRKGFDPHGSAGYYYQNHPKSQAELRCQAPKGQV
jgi:hypothetical protein